MSNKDQTSWMHGYLPKSFEIDETTYQSLISDKLMLLALKKAGVEEWEGYEKAQLEYEKSVSF